jgi:exodeoxyribonuclease V alpha subunit
MGTIIRLNKDEVVADFDGRTVVLSKKDMSTVKLGYAITVHKSQGSEFDYVMMPIVNEHEFTLNKNLLYTGITRAKKMFVLFGQKDALDNTIQKEIVWDRKSQIKSKLIKDHS